MNARTWTCIVLVLVTFGIYCQASDHDYINFDDPSYIINNPHVTSGLTIDNIDWAFTSIHASNWHPVTWLSHMLDIEFFGAQPKWQHLVNVIFHLLNTLLLYLLLFRTTGAHWKSSFVAGLFALHPLHVESVAWIAERKDVLSAFFFFITLHLYHLYVIRPSYSRYILSLIAFSIGLMSKPMLVTLPFILLLMDYWPLQRLSFSKKNEHPSPTTQNNKNNSLLLKIMMEKLPFLALSVISSIITFYAQSRGGAVAKIKLVPISFRFLNSLVAYANYIFKMILPRNLSVIYPLPDTITILQGLAAGSLLAVISTLSIRMGRRHPYLIVGWLWYIGMLVPVIGLVQVGRQSMADRYTYLPLTGLFIIVAWGVPSILQNWRYRNMLLSIMSVLLLFTYSLLTWLQIGYWKNSVTLFRHATEAISKNHVAYNLLGSTYTQSGMLDEAISNYSEALRISPEDEEAISGIGIALAKKGDLEGATSYFRKAVYLEPNSAECHSNLGFALSQQGQVEDGIRHLLEAIRLQPGNPKNAEIHFHIGTSLAAMGKIDPSMDHFVEAIRIKPDFVEAHYNLGVALAKQGKWDQAISSFSMALRLNPDLPEAALSLEKAKRMKGK
jgi:tetratricopeptide (TPR) repeat protein